MKKNLEKLTSPPKQLKSIWKEKKSFPAKQEEQEEGKFAQSWLHSAGRGKGTAGNFAFLPICFAFTRRRRVHQGQGAHRSGNRPWILSWLRSQLHPIVAWTTSPLFSPADLAGDHQQSTSQTVVEEKNKSFYFGMSLQRSLTNQQTRGIAFSPLLISLLEGAQAWRVLTQLSLFNHSLLPPWASLVAPMVKNLPAIQETRVWSLGREDLLEKEMVIHSSILAWRIPWTAHGVTKSQTWLSD